MPFFLLNNWVLLSQKSGPATLPSSLESILLWSISDSNSLKNHIPNKTANNFLLNCLKCPHWSTNLVSELLWERFKYWKQSIKEKNSPYQFIPKSTGFTADAQILHKRLGWGAELRIRMSKSGWSQKERFWQNLCILPQGTFRWYTTIYAPIQNWFIGFFTIYCKAYFSHL